MNNASIYIGEVVDLSSSESITLELVNSDYDVIRNPLISKINDSKEVLFCALKIFENSIDSSRKAIAYHMNPEDLQKEHPEQTFLIKPYLTAALTGSVHQNTFTNGVQMFNIGLHSRFEITSLETIRWFQDNVIALSTLFKQIYTNLLTKPQLKSICTLFLKNDRSLHAKSSILNILSSILCNDYLYFKEIAEYIQQL